MWQAEHVQQRLAAFYPASSIEILGLNTRGDQILDRPLAEIGGKGLFIKELEVAMHQGFADLAVHSLKDVPMEMPDGFSLSAILPRENPCDAFVSNTYTRLEQLPAQATVGTASLRRGALLQARFPQLQIKMLRGNLDTRLRKLDEAQFDAIILAAAGLLRLGLSNRITSMLSVEESLPAPGQGALGIEILSARQDVAAWLAPLNDFSTMACTCAERSFSAALGGSCRVPLGAYASLSANELHLRGFVASVDGQKMLTGQMRGNAKNAAKLGHDLAQQLLDQGAQKVLATQAL